MNDFWTEFGSNRQIRVVATVALGLLAVFLLALTVKAFMDLDENEYPSTSISVEGTGTVTATPDIASISFSVMEEAATVAAAQDAATARTDRALAALDAAGVERKDVTTSSYSIYPQYNNVICPNVGPCAAPTIRAYQVSQSIDAKVRDTDKVGAVLQGLGDAGVQNVSGPNFTIDDPENLKAEARTKAVADAKAKAQALADELGVRLGKVVGFWENTEPGYPMPYERAEMSMAYDAAGMKAPSLPVGEGEYVVRVSVTFELK
ncbi:MAG: SIMPL domain-containing protein [Candidatus Pacebacteria bacterium]|nr:SIMPL domain-containing protein [Candidatus Paceibacterota bacterium]MBP9840049.1 SIMPL domain-containing protein [Candidatus Paceibacterota bacterium]